MNIRITGFIVRFSGDESAGIFPQEWEVKGDFEFDTLEDLDLFKNKLIEAWEYASDTPISVETFEEIRERDIKSRPKTTEIPENEWGVHITHCCVDHGCKYGYDDCPVYLGIVEQKYPCEDCNIDW